MVRDSIIFDTGPTGTTYVASQCAAPCNVQTAWTTQRNLQVGVDPGYATANPTFPTSAADANKYVPTVGSNADTLVNTSCNTVLSDAFFDASADLRGRVRPEQHPGQLELAHHDRALDQLQPHQLIDRWTIGAATEHPWPPRHPEQSNHAKRPCERNVRSSSCWRPWRSASRPAARPPSAARSPS